MSLAHRRDPNVRAMIAVRLANPDDAPAMASLHVEAWHDTYTGLLPQSVIDARTFERRLDEWRAALADHRPAIVVACVGTALAGFACGESAHDPLRGRPVAGYDAYLDSLYVARAHQRLGIGRRLLGALGDVLQKRGARSLALHVLATNPARAFYERAGARFVADEPPAVREGMSWNDAVYAWDDLRVLVR